MESTESQGLVEVCVDSCAGAAAAHAGGAQRIELCCNLLEGGCTPSIGMVKQARLAFPRPGKLMVLIRPRGGDFVNTPQEMLVMREDIIAAGEAGADGVVFGCLTPAGEVDVMATGELLNLATNQGLDATFHRAFDMLVDQSKGLQQLKTLGMRRVLTSGGGASALVGVGELARLVGEAGRHIVIMAGGGVTEHNVAQLISRTGVQEVHSTAARSVLSSTTYKKPGFSLCSNRPPLDYAWSCADAECVAAIKAATAKAVHALPK